MSRKKVRRTFAVVGYIAMALLSLLVVFLLINKIAGKVPSLFGYSVLSIISPSMEPQIKQGAVILVKQVEPEDLKVNDVIAFYSDDPAIKGSPNTHRIIEIVTQDGKLRFVTCGDANHGLNDEAYAREECIIGRYEKTLLKDMSWLAPAVPYLLAAIILAAIAMMIIELVTLAKTNRDNEIAKRKLAEEAIAELTAAKADEKSEVPVATDSKPIPRHSERHVISLIDNEGDDTTDDDKAAETTENAQSAEQIEDTVEQPESEATDGTNEQEDIYDYEMVEECIGFLDGISDNGDTANTQQNDDNIDGWKIEQTAEEPEESAESEEAEYGETQGDDDDAQMHFATAGASDTETDTDAMEETQTDNPDITQLCAQPEQQYDENQWEIELEPEPEPEKLVFTVESGIHAEQWMIETGADGDQT